MLSHLPRLHAECLQAREIRQTPFVPASINLVHMIFNLKKKILRYKIHRQLIGFIIGIGYHLGTIDPNIMTFDYESDFDGNGSYYCLDTPGNRKQ